MNKYNDKIDVVIPVYNVPEKILFRCLSSIACQTIVDDIDVTIVDDASDEAYKEIYNNLALRFEHLLNIKVIGYTENGGPGVARQFVMDNVSNGYITFIDADDTFNGAYALQALRNAINMDNGVNVMAVGVFDEVHESQLPPGEGPLLMPHDQDMIWMFGKLYKRSFIDKYKLRFHPTSRANEDNGFNTIIRLISNEQEQIKFIPAHVYFWHESPNSITRANDCQYSYGGSIRDSFYGYVENMIYAVKEAKRRNPYNGMITMWAVSCMLNIYEYYIEGFARANEHAENNFKWCKLYYDEVFKDLEKDLPPELLAQHYNEVMRNAYMGNKLEGIIPHMTIFEFLNALRDYKEN
jgi:glycosyltransferase involved in cell wall biosynthesis